jgi:hypothetical protein
MKIPNAMSPMPNLNRQVPNAKEPENAKPGVGNFGLVIWFMGFLWCLESGVWNFAAPS